METIKIGNIEYVTTAALSFGDYGGYGSVGLGNIRRLAEDFADELFTCSMGDLAHAKDGAPYGLGKETLDEITREKPVVIRTYGDYSSEQAWIRSDVDASEELNGYHDGRDGLDGLCRHLEEDYPCLDDEDSSRIEMEWETEAFESWLRHDLLATLPEDLQDIDWREDFVFECYRRAVEVTNTYPVAEYSSVYIDVDRIAEAFGEAIATDTLR